MSDLYEGNRIESDDELAVDVAEDGDEVDDDDNDEDDGETGMLKFDSIIGSLFKLRLFSLVLLFVGVLEVVVVVDIGALVMIGAWYNFPFILAFVFTFVMLIFSQSLFSVLTCICFSNRFLTDDTKLGRGNSSLFISLVYVHLITPVWCIVTPVDKSGICDGAVDGDDDTTTSEWLNIDGVDVKEDEFDRFDKTGCWLGACSTKWSTLFDELRIGLVSWWLI